MRTWLAVAWLLCAVTANAAELRATEFSAKVIIVIDGDTVLAVRDCAAGAPAAPGTHRAPPCRDAKPVKIRLAEIDAPEKEQPGGMESKNSLSSMVLKQRVRVQVRAVDKYGRLVAHLAVNGKDVSEQQLQRGMAWEYSFYHSNKAFIALQEEARRARRGLWAEAGPVPPWDWRKLHEADPRRTPQGPAAPAVHACGSKHLCAQMRSCEEARFYLTRCGVKSLDGNGDGVCEDLCGGRD